MHLTNRKTFGFTLKPLHRKKEPHAFHYLSQRTSFWIAILSVTAYVAGNMMGQHGWHVFWASVMGKADDTAIVYTGTVTPIALVPDYAAWSRYGGDPWNHTFSQVPSDLLIPLPVYVSSEQRKSYADSPGDIYSIGHLGSYATGAEHSGSHPGVDIRVPEGTPIRSIAAGVVEETKEGGGFGKVIVIRHPNVPDPDHPTRTTTLYSAYAHLSAIYVTPGTVLRKGDRIGLSGSTGFATGPHLHFQIDRSDAPWHPYWPFSTGEQVAAGYRSLTEAIDAALHQERGEEHTVHPMLYVQANLPPVSVVASSRDTGTVAPAQPRVRMTLEERVAARRAERLDTRTPVRTEERVVLKEATPAVIPTPQPEPITQTPEPSPVVIRRDTVVTTEPSAPVSYPEPPQPARDVDRVDLQHDGAFEGRTWERVRVTLLDENGYKVENPSFDGALTLRPAYGEAEFRPTNLTASDFTGGIAEVLVLPRGRRTLVIQVFPLGTLSRPMVYEGN